MNKIIIAIGVALVTATSAFADSSALDINAPEVFNASAIDGTATSSIGGDAYGMRARLGDGSPAYSASDMRIDNTATSAIGTLAVDDQRGRLGDGSPAWF
jgi:hypothetical protein